ncbi:amidase [Halocynthiibacter styelae]|uniref:Amidase n=1 Tax=Halocynthiibacter styelae TaxID=2761955 RepID=A0A8J7LKV8_9RHOB|nr:amidase family protein [Paenihalocynthiibacter styelae]MBI1494735.1 amidase [Paenihalocynthiibacter styelae]
MSLNWQDKTASELGRMIGAGEIDPVDLTEAVLDAIEAHEMSDRIYARLTRDRAIAEAKAASDRAKSGARLSALDGVPISWKDLFDTAGVATEAGTALLKDRIPDEDAEVLKNATAAGLICVGKTHMSELAFSGLGLNPITASSPCVNDHDAVSGGSSSGAAASVAFGLAPAAIGSDTGGSVRIPAAWNDLVGLKTTSGRLSLEGVVPLCAWFDTVGPLARSVEDCAQLLALMEGGKAADLRGADLAGKRFLVLETVAMDDVRDAPGAAFQSAVERLQAAEAQVDRGDIPEVAEIMELTSILYTSEAWGTWKDVIEANPDVMFPEILGRFQLGQSWSAGEYIAAWQKMEKLRAGYLSAVAQYDAVIMPTSPILPPNAERLMSDHDYYITENLLALRNTRIGNLMGLTALTLPTGVPSCGITLMTPPDTEERLLRLGAAAEAALA